MSNPFFHNIKSNSRLKDVLIIAKDAPPIIGGSCLMLEKLINSSPTQKMTLITTSIKNINEYKYESKISIIRSKKLRFWNESLITQDENKIETLFFRIKFLRELVRISFMFWICLKIIRGRYDVIFSQQVDKWFFIVIFFARFILNKRVVSQAFGEELNQILSKKKNSIGLYHIFLIKAGFLLSDEIVAITENAKSQLVELGINLNKIRVIYPGVNTNLFHPNVDSTKLKKEYDYTHNHILLFVSRIEKRKGQDTAIKVIPELEKKGLNNIKLIIIGNGIDLDYLKSLVKELQLETKVFFLSNISTNELPSYYCLSDIFLYLGRKDLNNNQEDGFGIVCLEANACGKPVIGGNVGGIIEAVVNNQTGIIVNPNNIDEVAENIEYLLKNKAILDQLGRNGLKRAKECFDWDIINKKYWDFILELNNKR